MVTTALGRGQGRPGGVRETVAALCPGAESVSRSPCGRKGVLGMGTGINLLLGMSESSTHLFPKKPHPAAKEKKLAKEKVKRYSKELPQTSLTPEFCQLPRQTLKHTLSAPSSRIKENSAVVLQV